MLIYVCLGNCMYMYVESLIAGFPQSVENCIDEETQTYF